MPINKKATMSQYRNLLKHEDKRLAALRKLKILDSPYESLFDAITLAASEICKSPIALIAFVDEERQ